MFLLYTSVTCVYATVWKKDAKRQRERNRHGRKERKRRKILLSWYHMAGPPYLMRQRSMYSLALSHGRHPNHAKVNLFKQSALPPRYAICMHWFESGRARERETGDFIPEEFSSDRGRQLSPFPQHSHQTQKPRAPSNLSANKVSFKLRGFVFFYKECYCQQWHSRLL